MRTIVLVSLLAAFVQEDVRTGGKVAWAKDFATAEKRGKLEQRAVLLYFTDSGLPSKALDAGAWSNRDVISVTRRLKPVMLECPDDKAHEDLRKRFKVSAFPTIAILEPDGKTTTEITAREPADLEAELLKFARKFPGRDVLWLSTMEAGIERADSDPRPIALYFHAADDDLGDAQDRITKLAGQSRLDKFIWIELTATMDDKDPLKVRYEYYSLPAIAIVDSRFPEPKWLTTFEVKEKMKPRDMEEKLEKMLKKFKDTKIKK